MHKTETISSGWSHGPKRPGTLLWSLSCVPVACRPHPGSAQCGPPFLPNYFGTILVCLNFVGTILELFWNYFGTFGDRIVQTKFKNSSKKVPTEIRPVFEWNLFGTILELFWNFFGTI